MAKTGFIEIDQGQLFWKYDSPVDHQDSAQSGPRSRPVLLFIHVTTLSDLSISFPFTPIFGSEENSGEKGHICCSSNKPSDSTDRLGRETLIPYWCSQVSQTIHCQHPMSRSRIFASSLIQVG